MLFTNYLLRYELASALAIYATGTDVWNRKPAVLMAVKTANDLNIFTLLSQATSVVTCEELAAQKNADIQLVGKFYLER
jgi:hypothetical protein